MANGGRDRLDWPLSEIEEVNNTGKSSRERCGNCGENIPTRYCCDCAELMCDACTVIHKKWKTFKEHHIIKPVQNEVFDLNTTTPCCSQRSNESLKLYCVTCKVLVCIDCMKQLHRDTCNCFDQLSDNISIQNIPSVESATKNVNQIKETLKSFDSRAKEIGVQNDNIKQEISSEFARLGELLKKKVVDELELLTKQKLQDLEIQRKKVEELQVKFERALNDICDLERGAASDMMKESTLKEIEKMNAEFDSDKIQPETKADLKFPVHCKQQLQMECEKFVLSVDSDSISPGNSYILDEGLRIVQVGEQIAVEFIVITKSGKQFVKDVKITAKLVHAMTNGSLLCEVLKKQDGKYKIIVQPASRGKHKLHVMLEKVPLRGSPYLINVIPSLQNEGRPVKMVGILNQPTGTTINRRGEIVVAEKGRNCISVLNPETGKVIRVVGTGGSKHGELSQPHGVAVDSHDNIYVTDYYNHRVQKFTSQGRFISTVGSFGSKMAEFNYPLGICYSKAKKHLYVCDSYNHRIKVLSTDLAVVFTLGTKGNREAQFQYPYCAALDDADNLYVTDYRNNRIQVFTSSGEFVRAFSNKSIGTRLSSPRAIAIDSSNTVYVSEDDSSCFSAFNTQGDYITSYNTAESGLPLIDNLYGLSVDRTDTVLVSCVRSGRIKIYH